MDPTTKPAERIEQLPNGVKLNIGHDPDPTKSSMASLAVDGGLSELRDFMAARDDIQRDQRLSALGRSEKLDPLLSTTATVIANLWNSLDGEERHLEKDERHFFAVPAIDSKNAGDAIREREIRDYVRGLSTKEQGNLLKDLQQGGHEQILLALMRSPIPVGFIEKFAADAWRDLRRASDPGFVERLAIAKASVEWGRRSLAHVAGVFVSTTQLTADKLYRAVADKDGNAKGYQAFGISAAYAEQMQRLIAGKKLMAK